MVRTLVLLLPFLSLACGSSDTGLQTLTGTGGGAGQATGGTAGAPATGGMGGTVAETDTGAPGAPAPTGGTGGDQSPGTGGDQSPGTGGSMPSPAGGATDKPDASPEAAEPVVDTAPPVDTAPIPDASSCSFEAFRAYHKLVATTYPVPLGEPVGDLVEKRTDCMGCGCTQAAGQCGTTTEGDRVIWLPGFSVYLSSRRGFLDSNLKVLSFIGIGNNHFSMSVVAQRELGAKAGDKFDYDIVLHRVDDNLAKPGGSKVVTDTTARIAGTCLK